MSETALAEPTAEPEVTVVPQVENTAPETTTTAAPETAEPAKQVEPAKPGWEQQRIDQLTRKFRDAERQVAALQLELAKVQPQQSPEQRQQADIALQIEQRAAEKAAESLWNAQCNKIYSDGTTADPQFPSLIENFAKLGGLPPSVIEASMEAGEAHKVLAALAKDLDQANAIFQMTPARQAVAIAKFAAKLDAEPKVPTVSNAPPPVGPKVGSNGRPAVRLDDDKTSVAEWMAMREKEVAARRRR